MKLRLTPYIPHRPTPKQVAFLSYDGLEAFYGGAAGGGKTDALLMAALQYVDHPNYSAIIFRKSYTDLALPGAIMDRAHQWLADAKKKGAVHWDRDLRKFTFSTGAKLAFGYVQHSNDKWRYQSAEFQFIGWDELTEFENDDAYLFLFTRLRRLKDSTIPLRVRAASNPIGSGSYWVKKRFLELDPPPKNTTGEIDKTQRIWIPATFKDNPHIDQESYDRALIELPEKTRAALREGEWEAIEGAAFPEFSEEIHVLPPLPVLPENMTRIESMDFGVSNPTAWYAAGVDPQGFTLIHGEHYQADRLISHHASTILTLRSNHWGDPVLAVCDPSIKNRTGFGERGRGETVHSEFSKNGIYLVPANNDRIAGRVRISELLRADPALVFPEWHPRAGELGSPRLFISSTCRNLIEQIKHAPLDPQQGETVDPYWESRHGHAVAALRYLVTSRMVRPSGEEVVYREAGRGFREWNPWVGWREA